MRSGSALAIALAAVTGALSAQQPVGLDTSTTQVLVSNAMPVPLAVLVIGYDGDGLPAEYGVARVNARSQTAVMERRGHSYLIAQLEPIHSGATAKGINAICDTVFSPASIIAHIDTLKLQLQTTTFSETPEASDYIASIAASAQLTLAMRRKEFELDHLAYEDRIAYQELTTHQDFARRAREQREENVRETVGEWMAVAAAFSEEQAAVQHVLGKEAEAKTALAERAAAADRIVRRRLNSARVEREAGRAFNALLVAELGGGRRNARAAAPALRVCSTTPAVQDWISLRLVTGDRSINVQRARVTYERGGSDEILLRRVDGSSNWVGRIYWPVEARRARVRLVNVTGNDDADWINLNRVSLVELSKKVHKTAEALDKAAKETTFRAQGSDHIKTVIIP